jgi:hypothetical protein
MFKERRATCMKKLLMVLLGLVLVMNFSVLSFSVSYAEESGGYGHEEMGQESGGYGDENMNDETKSDDEMMKSDDEMMKGDDEMKKGDDEMKSDDEMMKGDDEMNGE